MAESSNTSDGAVPPGAETRSVQEPSKESKGARFEELREAKYRRFEELKGLILFLQLRSFYKERPTDIDQWVGSFDLRTWDKIYNKGSERDCKHARAFARSIAAKDRFVVLESRDTDIPLCSTAWKDINWFKGSLERFRGYYKDELGKWAGSHFPEDNVDKYLVEIIRQANEQSQSVAKVGASRGRHR